MAGVLFVLIVFGGGMLVVLSKTEIGRALADRIRGVRPLVGGPDASLLEEVERLRVEVTDLQERMEFAERLLATRREPDRLESH
jgi:hypothetical protein